MGNGKTQRRGDCFSPNGLKKGEATIWPPLLFQLPRMGESSLSGGASSMGSVWTSMEVVMSRVAVV